LIHDFSQYLAAILTSEIIYRIYSRISCARV